jgi:hypothetical protein
MRNKRLVAALTMMICCAMPAAADPTDGEAALRAQLDSALWPADIVRLAEQYRRQFPDGPAAAAAELWRERAAESMRVLGRNDVRLHRAAFRPAEPAEDWAADLRLAALGDRGAAVRLAHRARVNEDGQAMAHRYVGWLQYATQLGDERASYELALHFRQQAQPVLAARYEELALNLGYQPPVALDNLRK